MTKRFFLEVNGIRLCCVDFGGVGLPALLLHGLAGRGNEWRSTAGWLTKSHRVLALDQRGHGLSDKETRDYSRDSYVNDVIGVLEQLNLNPVVLIGQSMGGLNAFLVASRRPQLVQALIVIEATPAANPSAQQDIAAWLDSWPLPFPTLADARAFFGGDSLYGQTWIEVLEERPDGYWPQFHKDTMIQSMADVTTRDYWEEWKRIRCPTLVVAGEKSGLPKDQLREMAGSIPDGSYASVPDAGHDLHLEQPEAWREIAQGFLRA